MQILHLFIFSLSTVLFFADGYFNQKLLYQIHKKALPSFVRSFVEIGCQSLLSAWFIHFGESYFPISYLIFYIAFWMQSRGLFSSRSFEFLQINIRFVVTCSLHMIVLGLTNDWFFGRELSFCITFAICVTGKKLLSGFSAEFNESAENCHSNEFRYFQYFICLSVLYIFSESILCAVQTSFGNSDKFAIASNAMILFLTACYLVNIYQISKTILEEKVFCQLNESVGVLNERISKLKSNAYFDPLTGAYSLSFLKQHLQELKQKNKEFSLIFIDLDKLKQINDTFGHHEGDKYLISFVNSVSSEFRSSDIIARIGGDEFVLVMEECNTSFVCERMNRIRSRLESRQNPFSFSFGIASSCECSNIENLIHLADERMYQEKKKNKCCCSNQ